MQSSQPVRDFIVSHEFVHRLTEDDEMRRVEHGQQPPQGVAAGDAG
jgi:hypothetical protein